MRALALLLIPVMILTSTPLCFAQGLSSQERLELLRRVEALRTEADAILKLLRPSPPSRRPPPARRSSTSWSA